MIISETFIMPYSNDSTEKNADPFIHWNEATGLTQWGCKGTLAKKNLQGHLEKKLNQAQLLPQCNAPDNQIHSNAQLVDCFVR